MTATAIVKEIEKENGVIKAIDAHGKLIIAIIGDDFSKNFVIIPYAKKQPFARIMGMEDGMTMETDENTQNVSNPQFVLYQRSYSGGESAFNILYVKEDYAGDFSQIEIETVKKIVLKGWKKYKGVQEEDEKMVDESNISAEERADMTGLIERLMNAFTDTEDGQLALKCADAAIEHLINNSRDQNAFNPRKGYVLVYNKNGNNSHYDGMNMLGFPEEFREKYFTDKKVCEAIGMYIHDSIRASIPDFIFPGDEVFMNKRTVTAAPVEVAKQKEEVVVAASAQTVTNVPQEPQEKPTQKWVASMVAHLKEMGKTSDEILDILCKMENEGEEFRELISCIQQADAIEWLKTFEGPVEMMAGLMKEGMESDKLVRLILLQQDFLPYL